MDADSALTPTSPGDSMPAANALETQSDSHEYRILQRHAIPEQLSTQTRGASSLLGPGSILNGRYELLEKIASDGIGVVYKALDKRDAEHGNSRFIAIKVLSGECKNDPFILKALHSEARKIRKLAHANIVTVYDCDRDGDRVYMTMEYLEGESLDKVIKANPNGMEQAQALRVIAQIGEALAYAHSHRVIHSDFKPGNIIIDKSNYVKVLDFGVARLADIAYVNEFDAGVLGGMTQAYASLEMVNKLPAEQSDDVYSLACVAYELLSGKHPFGKAGAKQAKRENLKPKRIKSLNKGQWQALSQALKLERKNRTKKVHELISGLLSAANKIVYFMVVSMLLVFLMYGWKLDLFPDIKQLVTYYNGVNKPGHDVAVEKNNVGEKSEIQNPVAETPD